MNIEGLQYIILSYNTMELRVRRNKLPESTCRRYHTRDSSGPDNPYPGALDGNDSNIHDH